MIEASGIDHIVLHVSDVQRSKQFYTELLGMTPYRENDRQVFLHAGGTGGRAVQEDGRLAGAGRRRHEPPRPEGGGRHL